MITPGGLVNGGRARAATPPAVASMWFFLTYHKFILVSEDEPVPIYFYCTIKGEEEKKWTHVLR